jgi:hypothetical protein
MTGNISFALLLVVLSACVMAQLTRGFISGSVQDPSRAAVADAKVRITNRGTCIHAEMIAASWRPAKRPYQLSR